jgi:hypothetical protein
VFETRALRRLFGPKMDEVIGGWRKLRSEEVHDFYSSPSVITINKSRRMRGVRHVARMGRTAYKLLVGIPQGKRPTGGPRFRWVDNINMDLVEVAWGGVDWIGLT